MAKIIAFLSNQKQSGKTTIAFNFAHILSHRNKRVLLVNLELNSFTFLQHLNKTKINVKNAHPPFGYFTYHKFFQIMFIPSNNTVFKISTSPIDYQVALIKQIKE